METLMTCAAHRVILTLSRPTDEGQVPYNSLPEQTHTTGALSCC